MVKIYGSDLCPDCVACKAAFDDYEKPERIPETQGQ